MNKFVKDDNKYLVSREFEKVTLLARVDDFNGAIYWIDDISSASRFDSLDDAKAIVSMQEQLGKIVKKEWKFEILEEFRSVKSLSNKE